ncbi:MAG: hypothetical protein RR738_01235 [Anaerorhabdus sp.]|uniref:HTH merR-type domain-containing protein n=1 Tax=bioreactor metagenome TaxID=1076179 RepID=A0A645FPQ6_9ZZZZ|nr:hypothetical protein [Anaerorhabdus sp.]MEA4874947.1 hypothetical protein [Anaerorhabdus sp.]
MEKNAKKEVIKQNLKDAGCDSETIDSFMICKEKGTSKEQVKLLEKHRIKLLDKVHENQKCIDCLDYLVYQINKENEEEK